MLSSAALEHASLDEAERRVLEQFVDDLAGRLGTRLGAVWLYGSRARGEQPGEESDVDVMVVATGEDARSVALDSSLEAAVAEGISPFRISVQTVTPGWIAGRRRIRSFYIQEVDRDKVVLYGET